MEHRDRVGSDPKGVQHGHRLPKLVVRPTHSGIVPSSIFERPLIRHDAVWTSVDIRWGALITASAGCRVVDVAPLPVAAHPRGPDWSCTVLARPDDIAARTVPSLRVELGAVEPGGHPEVCVRAVDSDAHPPRFARCMRKLHALETLRKCQILIRVLQRTVRCNTAVVAVLVREITGLTKNPGSLVTRIGPRDRIIHAIVKQLSGRRREVARVFL
jgi:hypothetical protein